MFRKQKNKGNKVGINQIEGLGNQSFEPDLPSICSWCAFKFIFLV